VTSLDSDVEEWSQKTGILVRVSDDDAQSDGTSVEPVPSQLNTIQTTQTLASVKISKRSPNRDSSDEEDEEDDGHYNLLRWAQERRELGSEHCSISHFQS
jgi:hypothetical protein